MITITLPIDRIRDFINSARFVPIDKDKISITYFKYLRIKIEFGVCSIYKINNKCFIIYSFNTNHPDTDFLIEDEKLTAYVNSFRGSSIIISYDGTFVELTDERKRQKQKFKSEYDVKPELYPGFPEINDNYINIEKEALDALSVAKVSAHTDDLQLTFCAVYMDGDKIYSSRMSNIYYRKLNSPAPVAAITPAECSMLSSYSSIQFSKSGSYNTYKSGGIIYGFIMPEGAKGIAVGPILENVKKSNYFTINVDELINFCQSTIQFAGGPFCDSTITIVEDDFAPFAEILYHEKESDKENRFETSVRLIGPGFSFVFSPSEWLPILKALPYRELNISDEPNFVAIWNEDDKNYTGIVSKRMLA